MPTATIVAQQLPASLQGQVFYQPSLEGFVSTQVARRREAQMEALVDGVGVAPAEVLTTGPTGRAYDRWLQRTELSVSNSLLRDRIFTLAQPQRHHWCYLNAGSGLLTKEALRRVPEGGVYACTHTPSDTRFTRASSGASRTDASYSIACHIN